MAFELRASTTNTFNREDGSTRGILVQVYQDVGSAPVVEDLPLVSDVIVKAGKENDDSSKAVKVTTCEFVLRGNPDDYPILDALSDSEPREFFVRITDSTNSYVLFEGFVKPDFTNYRLHRQVQSLQVVANDGFGDLADIDQSLAVRKTPDEITEGMHTALGVTRDLDYITSLRPTEINQTDSLPTLIQYPAGLVTGSEKRTGNIAGLAEVDETLSLYDEIKGLAEANGLRLFLRDGKTCYAELYEQGFNGDGADVYNGTPGGAYTHSSDNLRVQIDKGQIIRGGSYKDRNYVRNYTQQIQYPSMERDVQFTEDDGATVEVEGTESDYADLFIKENDVIDVTEDIELLLDVIDNPSSYLGTVRFLEVKITNQNGADLWWDNANKQWSESAAYFEISISSLLFTDDPPDTVERIISTFTTEPVPEGVAGTLSFNLRFEEVTNTTGSLNNTFFDVEIQKLKATLIYSDLVDTPLFRIFSANPVITNAGKVIARTVTVGDVDQVTSRIGIIELNTVSNTDSWVDSSGNGAHTEIVARRMGKVLLGKEQKYTFQVRDINRIDLATQLRVEVDDGVYQIMVPISVKHEVHKGYYTIVAFTVVDELDSEASEFGFTAVRSTDGGASGSGNIAGNNRVGSRVPPSRISTRALELARAFSTSNYIQTSAEVSGDGITSIPVEELDDNYFFRGQTIRIVNPLSLEGEKIIVAADQQEGDTSLSVEEVDLERTYPVGSYVFVGDTGLSAGIVSNNTGVKIFAEANSTGIMNQAYSEDDGEISSINVRLFETVKAGQEFKITNYVTQEVTGVVVDGNVGETYGPGGSIALPIEPQIVSAEVGDPININQRYLQAELNVTPTGILGEINASRSNEGSLGVLNTRIGTTGSPLPTGVTEIDLAVDQVVRVEDEQTMLLLDIGGNRQLVVADGDSQVSPPNGIITVQAFDPDKVWSKSYTQLLIPQTESQTLLNLTRGEAVVKVQETAGDITSMSYVELRANAGSGSALNLLADNVKVISSQTTFIQSLLGVGFTDAGDTQTFAGNGVDDETDPTNFPSTRSDGVNYLQSGDLAFDSNQGDRPWKYTQDDGPSTAHDPNKWVRAYTSIRGGDIQTDTLFARVIQATGQISYGYDPGGGFKPTARMDEEGLYLVFDANTDARIRFYDDALGGPNSEIFQQLAGRDFSLSVPVGGNAQMFIGDSTGAYIEINGNEGDLADDRVNIYGADNTAIGANNSINSADFGNNSVWLASNGVEPMRIDFESVTSAVAGSETLPSNPVGFLRFKIDSSTFVRVPYYSDS